MFHADADFSIAVKSSIEAYNVWRVALMQNLQLPDDLVPDGWFDLQVDQLQHRGTPIFRFTSICSIVQVFSKLKLLSLVHTSFKAYLPCHDQTRRSVRDLEDDASVACTKLTDFLKVVVLQFSHFLLLCKEGLQALSLLLIQLKLL